MQKIKDKISAMSSKEKTRWLIIIVLIVIVVLIYFSAFDSKSKESQLTINSNIDKELEYALSRMDGVGDVNVVINYESSGEKIPATSTDTTYSDSDSRQKSEITTVSGSALILKERLPEVRGVIVVADGAEDIGIRTNIMSAVTTLLGVSADKVQILY